MDQHLNVFKEVAERKSFSKAAEALHMSQPAVSQYIASVEKELGVRLLERNNKYVELNQAGRIVLQYAREIQRNYNQMKLLVSDLNNNPGGELKIGASYTIGEYVLPGMLARLQDKYPAIIPAVTIGNTEDIGNKLVSQEIDIGLVEGTFQHPKVRSEAFATDDMYIISCCRTSSLIEGNISMETLQNRTWIIREEGSGTREMLESFFSTHQLNPSRILTFGSTQTIKEGVEAGLGISLLSDLTFDKELQLNRVKILPVEGMPLRRHFSIIKNQYEFYPKSLKAFEELVKLPIQKQ